MSIRLIKVSLCFSQINGAASNKFRNFSMKENLSSTPTSSKFSGVSRWESRKCLNFSSKLLFLTQNYLCHTPWRNQGMTFQKCAWPSKFVVASRPLWAATSGFHLNFERGCLKNINSSDTCLCTGLDVTLYECLEHRHSLKPITQFLSRSSYALLYQAVSTEL